VGKGQAFLGDLRVIECSMLEPSTMGMLLASFGADVIKVESPDRGDYVRQMAWPFVSGVSLLHWHVNRGKRSIALDLANPRGREVFLDLVRGADILIEGMRPGSLERRDLGVKVLRRANPALVYVTLSGFGGTGPYRGLPSHGLAYDAWAAVAAPSVDDKGRPCIPDSTPIGTRVAPVWAVAAALAAVLRARAEGTGAVLDVAQSDAAAAVNWLAIEGTKAYQRSEEEVTGNPADGGVRRPPGLAGMAESVRYQYYRSRDGIVLFMASEREFWENFCRGVDREDLFSRFPGARFADHARGNEELRGELESIFGSRTTAEWVSLAGQWNVPICPVNDAASILDDPQFVE
jgi:crotonobetainyl-CoA:carnitine CoA-transferase CaiB-like acyl-CoA transferase